MHSAQGSNPNIYDSWRSQHIQRYQSDEYYYDSHSHDPYNEFKPKHSHHNPYSNNGANRFMEPNWNDGWNESSPYHHGSSHNSNHNNSRRFVTRDYDQHF